MLPYPNDHLPNRQFLRQVAGQERFTEGEKIFSSGNVVQLRIGADRATARVKDKGIYKVKLWRARGAFKHSCGCTVGREDSFCKHCVAVGLAWLTHVLAKQTFTDWEETPPTTETPLLENTVVQPVPPTPDLKPYILKLNKRRLLDLVFEAVEFDDVLKRRLILESIGATSGVLLGPEELAIYRQLLREAIECTEYIDYEDLPDYTQGVEEVLQPLAALLDSKQTDAIIELCELAIIELDRVSEYIEVADSSLSGIYDILQRLHLEACNIGHPDPVALARRLLNFELEGGLTIFNNALSTYSAALGPAGLTAYRRFLLEEWMALPTLSPTQLEQNTDGSQLIDHRRYQLTYLMEKTAALYQNDPDIIAAIKTRDLSSPQDFLAIAKLYADANRFEPAIQWAEQGLEIFSKTRRVDTGALRAFLIKLYNQTQQDQKATLLCWQQFEEAPNIQKWKQLKNAAKPTDWPQWQNQAIQYWFRYFKRIEHITLLTESLLLEDELETVLLLTLHLKQHFSPQFDFPNALWFKIASRCELAYPEAAIGIYQHLVEQLLLKLQKHSDSTLYPEIDRCLHSIHTLHSQTGNQAALQHYFDSLKQTYPQRRRLLKLIDTLQLS